MNLQMAPLPGAQPGNLVHSAITCASARATEWRGAYRRERRPLIERLKVRLMADGDQLARLICQETGKPLRFSRVEVEKTAEMLRAVLRRAAAADDEHLELATVRYRPHGTVAVITPFNNPVYLPLGKIVPAVFLGNTVVWKPAPEVTGVSRRVCDLLFHAGWPTGLVSLLLGGTHDGQALVNDPRIDAVSLTGSSSAGDSVQETCGRRRIPLQAELGGNNAAIVWQDADLPFAAAQVAAGAFDAAGQRCTANRRVIVHEKVRDPFLEFLVCESRSLAWGDPFDLATRIGPMATTARREFVAAMVDRASAACHESFWPLGRDLPSIDSNQNRWYPPTILCCGDPGHEIVQEESFGPVLVVQTAADWNEAIELCNGVRQGLAGAIFTRSRPIADRFLDEARAGILKLNQSTADAEVDVPFGGWKASGIGPPEHGAFDREFYTRPQTVYGSRTELPER